MLEFYEPILNLSDSLHHNTMGVILSLKDPVNGSILQSVVEKLRVRFPYFYVKAAYRGNDLVTVPNSLPMTVRHTWDPVSFNTESSNYHLAAWKYKEYRLAFEISHSLTDGSGVLPYVQSVLYLYLSKVGLYTLSTAYSPLSLVPIGAGANTCALGGWPAGSPSYTAVLKQYGVENPYRDSINNDKVYWIDNHIDWTISYLHEYYDDQVQAKQIGTFDEKYAMYQLVSGKKEQN